jgi:Fe-S-cluster containining protein
MTSENTREPQRVFRLNLEKYGLERLLDRNVLDLSVADLDALLNALGSDDISITLPVPFTPENVREMLARAECRKCGGCCVPNPKNPGSPGIEVFDDELKIIAGHLNMPYEKLRENTGEGKNQDLPYPLDQAIGTRHLPLPCQFYDAEKKECRIYQARPLVCIIYPVVLSDYEDCLDIKLDCDYGKDVARAAIKDLKENLPDLILRIQ